MVRKYYEGKVYLKYDKYDIFTRVRISSLSTVRR